MITFLQIAGGLVLLLGGGRFLVRAGVALAEQIGVSPLMIGLTVVAMGTSAPELLVNVMAASRGVASLGVGNVVGANIANVLLVLGAAGVVYPIARNPAILKRDAPVMLVAVLAFAGIAWGGDIARWQGVLMIACLVAYMVAVYRIERRSTAALAARKAEVKEAAVKPQPPIWLTGLIMVGAITALIVGSDLLVDGAITLARSAGLSEAVIGATIVAFGTVMPEAIASMMAALHRHTDLAIGNVIGSIVINTFGVLGLAAVVRPYPIPPAILHFDLWVMLAACLLLVLLGWRAAGIGRKTCIAMLAAYVAYDIALYVGVPARLAG
ncbi:MAG: calcium/sodium antiporter [Rhodospirillaceae bacterium]|nr:calcium/sodium antiporter [Rhodospirillaceae bacterium]